MEVGLLFAVAVEIAVKVLVKLNNHKPKSSAFRTQAVEIYNGILNRTWNNSRVQVLKALHCEDKDPSDVLQTLTLLGAWLIPELQPDMKCVGTRKQRQVLAQELIRTFLLERVQQIRDLESISSERECVVPNTSSAFPYRPQHALTC